ncbi:MAG: pantetheine-phosphate adenylyltransferase [Planctomycetota bacterium]|jgi:pantetheine-phosphate adenylyltransferase
MADSNQKIALFPGTFDPITNGHLDVIRRGVGLFDTLIVAVGQNPSKAELFTAAERVEMIKAILADEGIGAEVASYTGLTVDFAAQRGATVILRGLRDATDLALEFQLALTNRAVADIETVLIMSGEPYGFTSSSLIKQIAAAGNMDRLSTLLPHLVIDRMKERSDVITHMANLSDGHKS